MRRHRRQFLIRRGPSPVSGWTSTELPDGYTLHHDPQLEVERSGGTLLLGVRLKSGGGRFAEIEWPDIRSDYAGLMSIFHDDDGISSSPALLAPRAQFAPFSHDGMNWYPPPGTPQLGLLLRDQQLCISSRAIRPLHRKVLPLDSFTAATQSLGSSLRTAIAGLQEAGRRPFIALTAGLDSRTLLAAALAEGVEFETYTQVTGTVSAHDIRSARAISRYLGVRHHVIAPSPPDDAALRNFEAHTRGLVQDALNDYFLRGQYAFAGRGIALVRGGGFEVGRRYFARHLSDLDLAATGDQVAGRFHRSDSVAAEGLDRWLQWRRQHDNGLDLVDGFYLDQRIGGWIGMIEQALDLIDAISVHPAASEDALRALVTPTFDQRPSGDLQLKTVELLEPRLLRFPINRRLPHEYAAAAARKAWRVARRVHRRLTGR